MCYGLTDILPNRHVTSKDLLDVLIDDTKITLDGDD